LSLWRHLERGARALVRRNAVDREIRDEIEHYLDEAAAAHRARGLSPDDALRAARLELGNVTGVREQVASYGWQNVVDTLAADVRYAARRLRRNPMWTALAAITLALGIGASTAIFSAVNPVLFEPLPYPRADRIMMISDIGPGGSRLDVTFGTYRELLARSRSFERLAVMRPWQPTITGGDMPERLEGQAVSAEYFRVLGVAPALGRDFQRSDDLAGAERVVLLGHGLWQRRFGGDSGIVGRQIRLDDNAMTVAGVLPSGFENVSAAGAQVWTMLQYDPALPVQGREWGHHLRLVGRLRPGVDREEADRELDAIAAAPAPEFARPPWAALTNGLIVASLRDEVTAGVKPALLAVMGAVGLLLAIACVNVSNLLLARGAQRRGEFATRIAMGAGRARLLRQVLLESLLLAAIGGALGVAVAHAGLRALVALSPPGLPRLHAIALDGGVFAFALSVTTAVGLIVGLLPALHASRTDPRRGLQSSVGRTTGALQPARRALVVAEVALALVLLVSAGLLWRSLNRLFGVAPGFVADGLLTLQVQASGRRFDRDTVTHQFYREVLDAVRRLPGVTGAALTSQLPLSGEDERYGVSLEAVPADPNAGGVNSFRYGVSPGYIEAMGITLRRGRALDGRDVAGAPASALVSESFARQAFPGGDPVGQRIRIGPEDAPWHTIVGVVSDVRQASLAVSDADAVYTTSEQWSLFADRGRWLVVRVRGDPRAVASMVRESVWSVDRNQPIVRVVAMRDMLAGSAAERRFALVLFEAFALVALVLAAIGIHGVLSGSVTERLREIGVRSALGATQGQLVGLVVRQAMTLTGLGIAFGIAGAFLASRALIALLFGVSRLDPATYLTVPAVLVAVSAAACAAPAWRAARVDPAATLRSE
jgi:putative ABC transport system permease protein